MHPYHADGNQFGPFQHLWTTIALKGIYIHHRKEIARHPRKLSYFWAFVCLSIMKQFIVHGALGSMLGCLQTVSKEMHHKYIGFTCDSGLRSGDPDTVVFYHGNLKQVAKHPLKMSNSSPCVSFGQECLVFKNQGQRSNNSCRRTWTDRHTNGRTDRRTLQSTSYPSLRGR